MPTPKTQDEISKDVEKKLRACPIITDKVVIFISGFLIITATKEEKEINFEFRNYFDFSESRYKEFLDIYDEKRYESEYMRTFINSKDALTENSERIDLLKEILQDHWIFHTSERSYDSEAKIYGVPVGLNLINSGIHFRVSEEINFWLTGGLLPIEKYLKEKKITSEIRNSLLSNILDYVAYFEAMSLVDKLLSLTIIDILFVKK